jgi:hypothetical protein
MKLEDSGVPGVHLKNQSAGTRVFIAFIRRDGLDLI